MKTFLDFYADWCQPCKIMGPLIEELEKDFPDVKFKKIDADKNEKMADKYTVMGLPTFIIEEDGKEVYRFTGVQRKQDLANKLRD